VLLCSVFSITIVLQEMSDFSSLVYFVILGCIGGMGILLGICIVVRCSICLFTTCQQHLDAILMHVNGMGDCISVVALAHMHTNVLSFTWSLQHFFDGPFSFSLCML